MYAYQNIVLASIDWYKRKRHRNAALMNEIQVIWGVSYHNSKIVECDHFKVQNL